MTDIFINNWRLTTLLRFSGLGTFLFPSTKMRLWKVVLKQCCESKTSKNKRTVKWLHSKVEGLLVKAFCLRVSMAYTAKEASRQSEVKERSGSDVTHNHIDA